MDLIENIALPQSEQHILLLKYMLVLAYMIFIPYMALLFGSLLNSLYIKSKSQNGKGNIGFETIKFLTFNRLAPIGFGVVPFLSIQFIYIQLLQSSGLKFSWIAVIIFILLFIAIVLIYLYKHYFALSILFKERINNEESNTITESLLKPVSNFKKYGKYAFIILSIAIYLFFGLVNFLSNSANWEGGFLSSLIQTKSVLNFISFLFLALLLSNSFIIWNNHKAKEKYFPPEFSSLLAKISMIVLLILPALLLVDSLLTSTKSLSYDYFIITFLAIATILVLTNLFYKDVKEVSFTNSNLIIFFSFIFILLSIVREQYAFGTNIQLHSQKLSQNYLEYQNKLNAELGINVVVVSGADIFNGKCIACHNFDKKIVGPAYKDVLPKYEGKMQDLIKFVLNPIKVNPDYPSMPNQGLKPNEAEAIAEYIMNTYVEKYK